MSTGVRCRPSLVAGSSALSAMDHDQSSRGSLTPSVVLQCDIPETVKGSFYQGQVHVIIKDSVLQPSNPVRHCVELSQVMKTQDLNPVLFAYTDGGSDHRTTFRSVQLAWILLFIAEDLDMLLAARTAPGHSYTNPAERCMSTLNLGLQNCSFSRVEINDKQASQKVKSCNSMDVLRKQQPTVRGAWSQSIDPVRKLVESRFSRLIYSERQVIVHDPATEEELATFMSKASVIDTALDTTNIDPRQKDLLDKTNLEKFLETHCIAHHYTFQVKKCGADACHLGICKQPRLPAHIFRPLNWLPDPVPDDGANSGHYKPYSELKHAATSEKHRPSLQKKATQDASLLEAQGCSKSMFTAQLVRDTVECTGDHQLHGKVFTRVAQRCADPVELCYYASKHNYPGVCCYCAAEDEYRPQELQEKFFTVLPICDCCRATNVVITRMPKAGSKRGLNARQNVCKSGQLTMVVKHYTLKYAYFSAVTSID